MIYLASPYTAANPITMETRYLEACAAVAALTTESQTVYSPIVHYHVVAKFGDLPTDFNFWQHHNRHMLALAEELWVLILPDWQKSVGVASEIDYAAELNKPIRAVSPSTKYSIHRWDLWVEQHYRALA